MSDSIDPRTLPVTYSASARNVIDYVLPSGLGAYSGETLEQTRARHADAVVMTQDAAWQAQRAAYITEPVEVDAERFDYLLNVLPPCKWNRGGAVEWFHVSERICCDVVTWCARSGARFFTFDNASSLTRDELHAIIIKAASAEPKATA